MGKGYKTECYPFWNLEDIKKMIDGFTEKKQWHWRLAFMTGLLLGRRVSDTLDLKWNDLYEKNGRKRSHLEIIEDKTEKATYVLIPALFWKEVELYIKEKKVDPSESNYENDIFPTRGKIDENGKNRKDAAYRKSFKKVAEEAKIDYPVNTHSTRKTFGYYGIKLHPYDPSNIDILQRFFNHSSREITLSYIGLTQEKQDQYSTDWANVMQDVANGREIAIDNSPVITLKSEDFRDLIRMALEKEPTMDNMNEILSMAEKRRVQ